MVETRRWIYAGVVIVAVIVLAVIAVSVTPYPVTEFTPDGTNLGDFQIGTEWYNIFHIIFGTHVDKNWVTTTGLIQFLILPFFAIWMVMYGLFEEIVFFRRVTWFSPAMAFVVALISSSTGFLVRMMRGYLMIAGGMGIAFFGFILVLGILFWFIGRLGRFGVPIPGVVTTERQIGTIETALREARRFAASIEGHDPRRASRIRAIAGIADNALIKSPPDVNTANARVNEIQGLINEYRRATGA